MSIGPEAFTDVASEAYAASLFEDMANEIVQLRAEVKTLEDKEARSHDLAVEMGRSLLRRRDEITELEDKKKQDPKTGLLHYPAFEEAVRDRIEPAKRAIDKKRIHSLLIADLDNFKVINKVLGYSRADEICILPMADALRASLRPNEDIAGRFGGDEFVALLQDTDLEGAHVVAGKIRGIVNSIELPGGVTEEGQVVPEFLGLSVGIAPLRQGGSYETAFQRANEALKEAERLRGKNETVLWIKEN